jgi:hypothetical protein
MAVNRGYDPFCADGINWKGNEGDGEWGPDGLARVDHINRKQRADRESKFSTERTVVDDPMWPDDARVKRTSAQAYSSNPYGAGNNRKG